MADEKRILNKEQREAVEHGGGPLLIIAGAGTGKTTVITERIKHLILEEDILASEVLALTFTEKAAREMEERVDIALPYGYTQMWISTFHSFCDRLLRQEALHIGLNPEIHFRALPRTIDCRMVEFNEEFQLVAVVWLQSRPLFLLTGAGTNLYRALDADEFFGDILFLQTGLL